LNMGGPRLGKLDDDWEPNSPDWDSKWACKSPGARACNREDWMRLLTCWFWRIRDSREMLPSSVFPPREPPSNDGRAAAPSAAHDDASSNPLDDVRAVPFPWFWMVSRSSRDMTSAARSRHPRSRFIPREKKFGKAFKV